MPGRRKQRARTLGPRSCAAWRLLALQPAPEDHEIRLAGSPRPPGRRPARVATNSLVRCLRAHAVPCALAAALFRLHSARRQKNTRPVKAGCNVEGARLYFHILAGGTHRLRVSERKTRPNLEVRRERFCNHGEVVCGAVICARSNLLKRAPARASTPCARLWGEPRRSAPPVLAK